MIGRDRNFWLLRGGLLKLALSVSLIAGEVSAVDEKVEAQQLRYQVIPQQEVIPLGDAATMRFAVSNVGPGPVTLRELRGVFESLQLRVQRDGKEVAITTAMPKPKVFDSLGLGLRPVTIRDRSFSALGNLNLVGDCTVPGSYTVHATKVVYLQGSEVKPVSMTANAKFIVSNDLAPSKAASERGPWCMTAELPMDQPKSGAPFVLQVSLSSSEPQGTLVKHDGFHRNFKVELYANGQLVRPEAPDFEKAIIADHAAQESNKGKIPSGMVRSLDLTKIYSFQKPGNYCLHLELKDGVLPQDVSREVAPWKIKVGFKVGN